MVMTLSLPGVEVPGPAHADCSAWPLAAKPLFFTANKPRPQGQREWPALLGLADKVDPSYRT